MKKALVIGIVALTSAVTVSAGAQTQQRRQPQVQSVQSKPALGQLAWSNDGWLYQYTANGWARTDWSRTFPIRGNTAVYDTYIYWPSTGTNQKRKRVDMVSERGWIHEYDYGLNVRVKYPANNMNARYQWVDHTHVRGPRGWLNAAQLEAEIRRLRLLEQQLKAQIQPQQQVTTVPSQQTAAQKENVQAELAKELAKLNMSADNSIKMKNCVWLEPAAGWAI